MKVIIMEIDGQEAVALNREGQFIRIRNTGFTVGQEIVATPDMYVRQSPVKNTRIMTRIAAIAACFILVFGTLMGFLMMNSQPYGYVSVDINPSIEYRLNRFNKVVRVSAVNQDGEALLAIIGIENLKGEDIESALSLTVNELSVQGYLDGENTGIMISSSSKNDRSSKALDQKLKAYTEQEEKLAGITVITASVPPETVEEASNLGTTAGKLHLIKALGEDISAEAWLDRPIDEIYAAVLENGTDLSPDPETEIEPPTDDILEPDTSKETDTENATSAPVPDTTEEPEESTEPVEVTTDSESVTTTPEESESETEKETEIETETETETETESETETETETETESESETWPESEPEELPEEWPEEWPEPDKDNSGKPIWPEGTPWWIKLLWAFIFG